jgi:hypothetical protein
LVKRRSIRMCLAPFYRNSLQRRPSGRPALNISRRKLPCDAAKASFCPASGLAFQFLPTPTASRGRGPGTLQRATGRMRAISGAEQSHTRFGEPGEPLTRAPNLRTLGQGRRARQDLVHNPESTAKCGNCGEENPPRGKYRRFVVNPKMDWRVGRKFFCRRLGGGGQLWHLERGRLGTAVRVRRRSRNAQSRICHAVAGVSG